jgi:hypothetical protein
MHPIKKLKLVAPVNKTVKTMARILADKFYDGIESEAVRQSVREAYARMQGFEYEPHPIEDAGEIEVVDWPARRLKLVVPVDEAVKGMGHELASTFYDDNEAEAIRCAVIDAYIRKIVLPKQIQKETNGSLN